MFLLKSIYLAVLIYSGTASASIMNKARIALLQKQIIPLSSEICGKEYRSEISKLHLGLKEILGLAQDKRQGIDLSALEPNEQEVQFIAQQMCKSGQFSTQDISYLHSRYAGGNFGAQEQEYSTGSTEEFSESESDENAELRSNDIGNSTLISKEVAVAYLFGILSGGILLHYFVLVKGNTPGTTAITSKVRRPEL